MTTVIYLLSVIATSQYLTNWSAAKPAGHSIGNLDVNNASYNVKLTVVYDNFGTCSIEVKVRGTGINDTFNDSCINKGTDILALDHLLIYGNPEKDSLCLYTDVPSSLTVIREGECVTKTYFTKDNETKFHENPLNQTECELIMNKIKESKEIKNDDVNEYYRGLQENEPSSSTNTSTSNYTFSLTWKNTITQMIRNIISRFFKWVFGT